MHSPEWSLWPRRFRRNFQWKPSLRFAALTWGTRGDVQPFVALGAELVRRGHSMVLAARAPYRSFVEDHGLEFFEMEDDGTEDFMRALASSRSVPSAFVEFTRFMRSLIRPQFRQFEQASRGADVLITNGTFTAPALHIAEHRGIPIFLTFLDPGLVFTRCHCLSGDRIMDHGPLLNTLITRSRSVTLGLTSWDLVNAWRRERGMSLDLSVERLRPSQLFRLPAFAAWSPELVERPHDWPEWMVQTGRWRLPEQRQRISPRLRDFLAAGPPPIYFGFGSWGVHDKAALTDILLESLRITGDRAIFHGNTVDDRRFPEHVYVDDELPHDWLLPQVKAAVHHGGAGTTGAAVTAGVPAIVIPGFLVQGIWGHILKEKGIGMLLERRGLDAGKLAAALREVTGPEVRERAKALGARARAERA
ncbi:MAG: glycosyltransferase family 1 protein, partial [Polyangiaceae bacterium]|nr:glycosyltransferase family 1 protein [Polyangiaceae bacterium]